MSTAVVKTSLVSSSTRRRAPKARRIVTTTTRTKKRKVAKRPKNSSLRSSLPPLALDYINTVNNPFEHGPVCLGFGSLVPTNCYTAYYRTTVTSNADGSIAFALTPSVGNTSGSILYNNSGVTGTTWNVAQFTNRSSIVGVCTDARVVSGGIRAIPQIAATAAPGMVFAGSVPSINYDQIAVASPNGLATYPGFKQGFANCGASALIHPLDPLSFVFNSTNLSGYGGGSSNCTSSVPIIVLMGMPASTAVFIEAVLNIEGLTSYQSGSAAITNPGISTSQSQDRLSRYFSSLEHMWDTVRGYLPSTATVYQGASVARDLGQAALMMQMSRNIRRPAQQFFSAGAGLRMLE